MDFCDEAREAHERDRAEADYDRMADQWHRDSGTYDLFDREADGQYDEDAYGYTVADGA